MTQTLHYRIKLSIVDIVALFSCIQLIAKESDITTFLAQHSTYTYTRCIIGYPKYFREIKMAKDRDNSQFLFNFLESLSSRFSLFELFFLKTLSD